MARQQLYLMRFLPILLLGIVVGCPNYTRMRLGTMQEITEERSGRYFLAQSMYAGPFWDDDRARLLSPRRFHTLKYLKTVDGQNIPPGDADNILPVGTQVELLSVRFPTGPEVSRRPLWTPRFTTWVRVRVLGGGGIIDRRNAVPHTLIIPAFLEEKDAFDTWFDAHLSKDDPRPWLAELPAELRRATQEKRPVAGMDRRALRAALGFPDRATRAENGSETLNFGGHTEVDIEGGRVVRVREVDHFLAPVPR